MEGLIDREEMRKHPMMQPLFDENDEGQIRKMRESAELAMMAKENELVIAPIDEYPCTGYSVMAIDEITRIKDGKWENEQSRKLIVSFDPSKAPMVVFENSELKFVHTNIDEKEFEEFKERQRNNPLNNLWLELAIAEEKAQAERRRLWIRGIIKSTLNKLGKTPTDELLDAATECCLENCILPTLNPTRNHWFIDMLCCFCDGKPYEYDGGKVELKYKP